jgi:hypothetical protein
MWSHKSKFKGKSFAGDYELQKSGKTHFHLVDAKGKTVARFRSWQEARKQGWAKIK